MQEGTTDRMVVLLYALVSIGAGLNIVSQAAKIYTFENCAEDTGKVFEVEDGAVIQPQPQGQRYYSEWSLRCNYTFQVLRPGMKFLVQVTYVDTRSNCQDGLQITTSQANPATQWPGGGPTHTVLKYCDTRRLKEYIEEPYITVSWRTGPKPDGHNLHKGFRIILTALYKDAGFCSPGTHFHCGKDCISISLHCDGVFHCFDGEDETRCNHFGSTYPHYLLRQLKQQVLTTTRPITTATQVAPPSSNYDMLIILIFSGTFMVVLLVCIVLGCREQRQRQREAQTDNVALDPNTNPGYDEDGLPESPPPSYNMIARQTSYVSYISQSSSQLDIPPDYDEAKDLPDNPNGRRSRISRQISRNSSNSSNTRGRRVRRSISTTDGRRRPRFFSQRSVPIDNNVRSNTRSRITSDSGVFTEPPNTPVLVGVTSSQNGQQVNAEPSVPRTESHTESTDSTVFTADELVPPSGQVENQSVGLSSAQASNPDPNSTTEISRNSSSVVFFR